MRFRLVGVEKRQDSCLLVLLRAFSVEVQHFFGGVEKESDLCFLQRKLGQFFSGVMNTAVGEVLLVGVFKATSSILLGSFPESEMEETVSAD